MLKKIEPPSLWVPERLCESEQSSSWPPPIRLCLTLKRNVCCVKSLESISYYTIYSLQLELTGANKRLHLKETLLHKDTITKIF